jgi:hypothetical protein
MKLLAALFALTTIAQPLAVIRQDEHDFLKLVATITGDRQCEPKWPLPVSLHRQRMRNATPAFRRLLQAELDMHNAWVRGCAIVQRNRLRWANRVPVAEWELLDEVHLEYGHAFNRVAAAEAAVPGRQRLTEHFPNFASTI